LLAEKDFKEFDVPSSIDYILRLSINNIGKTEI
jgi:hypothetical protein